LTITFFQNSVKAQQRALENGVYVLTNSASNLCLGAKIDQQNKNGGQVQRWNFAYKKNQQWRIQYIGNGLYSIRLSASGLCLSAHNPPGSTLENGTIIELWHYSNGTNEKWQIEKAGDGDEYVIKLPGKNLCIEANGNPNYNLRYKNGCAIDLWDYQGAKSRNEIWHIRSAPVKID
jgi:Ricin-type beta-trefoil lectin domain-like